MPALEGIILVLEVIEEKFDVHLSRMYLLKLIAILDNDNLGKRGKMCWKTIKTTGKKKANTV